MTYFRRVAAFVFLMLLVLPAGSCWLAAQEQQQKREQSREYGGEGGGGGGNGGGY